MTIAVDQHSVALKAAARAPRRRLGKKLLAVCIGAAIGLVFAELAVRLWVPVRNVGPSFTTFDPIYGKRLKANFSCERITPEFRMRLTTNALGFRGPMPNLSFRDPILFLGDSFTLGFGVNDGEEFTAVVGETLRRRFGEERIPVVNAGIGDVGNGRWVRFLLEEAPRYHPRAVVLQLCGNDFSDNLREPFAALSLDGGLEIHRPQFTPALGRLAQTAIEGVPGLSYSHLVSLLREARFHGGAEVTQATQAQRQKPKTGDPGDELTYRLVLKLADICRQQGCPMLVLVADFDGPRLSALARRLAENSIPLVAVPPKTSRPDLYFTVDGHWTAAGHQYAAELILDELQRLGSFESP